MIHVDGLKDVRQFIVAARSIIPSYGQSASEVNTYETCSSLSRLCVSLARI